MQKTTLAKTETVQPNWYVIDGDNQVVGRLATRIATVLMGKHKTDYTPHVDCGDYVIVVNVEKVRFTGVPLAHPTHPHYSKKLAFKEYETYSGYPGGRRIERGEEIYARKPEHILSEAVRRMLPKNKLASKMLKKLKLYVGPNHENQAQQPEPFPMQNLK